MFFDPVAQGLENSAGSHGLFIIIPLHGSGAVLTIHGTVSLHRVGSLSTWQIAQYLVAVIVTLHVLRDVSYTRAAAGASQSSAELDTAGAAAHAAAAAAGGTGFVHDWTGGREDKGAVASWETFNNEEWGRGMARMGLQVSRLHLEHRSGVR